MRSGGSVAAFWVGVVVLAVAVGIPLVQADWHLFGILLAPALLLAWLFWIVLFRPAVHYDDDAAMVINIGRKHLLPWSHVTGIRQSLSLVFELDAGKPIQAYGVPSRRPPGNIASAIDRRTRPTQNFHQDAEVLDSLRESAAVSSEPVASGWDTVPLAIGAVLVVAVAMEIAVVAAGGF
jgi:hypothetical protein